MSEYGLIIADDGQILNKGRNKIDSRRRTLILDLEVNPAHMQIITTGAGTGWTDGGLDYGRRQDLLFSMKHKLGFTPLVDAFFYTQNSTPTGGYANDVYFLSGSAGTLADTVSYEADATDFRIVHNFDSYGVGTGYTSTAPSFTFKVKFYIYSIDVGRAVNYGYPYDGVGNIYPQ